eukprot:12141660-Heterocapsa_arctica.AAC.1
MKRAKRLLRYVKGTVDLELRLNGHGSTDPELQRDDVDAYADANWGSGATRKSTSGDCLFWRGTLLATWSRTQATITLSTAETELLAMGVAVQEGMFVQYLWDEMINGTVIDGKKGDGKKVPLQIHSDSSAARAIVARRGVSRLKHLAIRQ